MTDHPIQQATPCVIREAAPDDATRIAAVIHTVPEIKSVSTQSIEITTATVANNLARIVATGTSSAYVIEDSGGAIVGYCAVHWVPFLFLPGGEAYVTELFVHSTETGKQFGTCLLTHVVDEAKRRGCSRLSLLNGRDGAAYQRGFYRKLGWTERDRMANFTLPISAPLQRPRGVPCHVQIEYLADRPEFTSTLAVWHRREWGYLRPDESVETRVTKLQAWSGRRQIPTVFVASAGETLLGSSMLVAHDMETRLQWSPWLAGVVVAPEHRRRGIGAALTERTAAEARLLGFPAIYLYTLSTEQYYTRLGWRFIEHSTNLGAPVTIMSFNLR